MTSVRVAVAGGSGYTGAELLRLLSQHPNVQLTAVTSEKSAGTPVSTVYPHLQGIVPLTFEALAPEALAERADVLFLALPHTKSMGPVASCMKAGKRVIGPTCRLPRLLPDRRDSATGAVDRPWPHRAGHHCD